MPLDLAAIKARLASIPAFGAVRPADTDEVYCPLAELRAADDAMLLYVPAEHNGDVPAVLTFVAHAPTDIAALIAEVERLRAVLDSSSSALTEIAEDIRRELWLDEQDFRGHKLYDRIMDALPALDGGEVSALVAALGESDE